jgi:hypothetical protein
LQNLKSAIGKPAAFSASLMRFSSLISVPVPTAF